MVDINSPGSTIWAPQGVQGPPGPVGPAGPAGPAGPQGGPGPDAATFVAFANHLALGDQPSLLGYRARNIYAKLDDIPSVKDYANVAAAEAAVTSLSGGGLLFYPSGTYPSDTAQAPSNIMREYNGPNTPGSTYARPDNLAVAAKLLRYSDNTNHVGKEGYVLFLESTPKGSTDGTVPGSDFGLGVSVVKQNWTNSQVAGQNCGINTVTRGGYFNSPVAIIGILKSNPAVVTTSVAHGYTTGDTVIIQNVLGMFQANAPRRYTITVLSATTFQLNGVDSTGFATYSSGGIVQKDAGVSGFYNPGDTASYIANTVQSSANGFAAILEGASYYMPSGQFITGTKGIRVQLGAIKNAENLAIGVLSVAANGDCGAAFQAQNSRSDAGIEGNWAKAFSYITDFGSGVIEAFAVNQLGNIVLRSQPGATTPSKMIRTNSTNGGLEVVNDANTAVIFTLSDAGNINLAGGKNYGIGGQQVVGPRIGSWNAPVGAISRGAFNITTATTATTAAFLGALITDLRTHGLIGD